MTMNIMKDMKGVTKRKEEVVEVEKWTRKETKWTPIRRKVT